MSEATELDLAADDWTPHGNVVSRGDYPDEQDVWVVVEAAEEPETIAARIADALNTYTAVRDALRMLTEPAFNYFDMREDEIGDAGKKLVSWIEESFGSELK